MKRLLIVVAVLAAFAFGQMMPRPRFELKSAETLMKADGISTPLYVYAIHDKESGIELVCTARSGWAEAGISCVPTGRNWK
jgi:hypothetical protein